MIARIHHDMPPAFATSVALIALAVAALAPAAADAADVAAGETAFVRQCALCHTVAKGGRNGFGPNLFGTVGRAAASAPGFEYSPAFKSTAAWTWNADTLAAFMSNPRAMVPGNRMGMFQGIADRDRDDLVAYLAAKK